MQAPDSKQFHLSQWPTVLTLSIVQFCKLRHMHDKGKAS